MFHYAFSNLHYIASHCGMIYEWRIEHTLERSGRGLNRYTIPTYAWRRRGKLRKTSIRRDVAPVDIRTKDLPNTSLQLNKLFI
jgi:hypothetical protein